MVMYQKETLSIPIGALERHFVDQRWQYALSILLGMDGRELPVYAKYFHYGDVQEASTSARIVIKPSTFFHQDVHGTASSLPQLPLNEIMGVPLLFGTPEVMRQGDRIVTNADMLASAYFLLTRYEEVLRREERDQHGRFPGKSSLSYRGGFLGRPIVDEYAQLLHRWLGQVGIDVPERPQKIRRVYLTHDVDIPWRWPSFRMACLESSRRLWRCSLKTIEPLLCYFGLCQDQFDSFDWIVNQNMSAVRQLGPKRVEFIVFMIAGGNSPYDGYYQIRSRKMTKLVRRLIQGGAKIGLHASYEAGTRPELIPDEIKTLTEVTGRSITDNRHHFLGSREPEHLRILLEAGIKRDFTMGYADVLGFRLGTSRAVQWFDPQRGEVTDLTLHPLTLMECTLDRPEYMGLDYEQAYSVSTEMLEQIRRHNGDVTLLWHNTELATAKASAGSYQKRLYTELLNLLGN